MNRPNDPVFLLILLGVHAVAAPNQVRSAADSDDWKRLDGKVLMQAHCSRCHLVPELGVLDRHSWSGSVLVHMKVLSGLDRKKAESIEQGRQALKLGVVPSVPMMPIAHWKAIENYVLSNAPAANDFVGDVVRIPESLSGLRPTLSLLDKPQPQTLLVKAGKEPGTLFIGYGLKKQLQFSDLRRRKLECIATNVMPVSVAESANGLYIADIGSYSPNLNDLGRVVFLPKSPDGWGAPKTILDGLPRPTDVKLADLNGDGRTDMVVSMFGWWHKGRLSWFESKGTEGLVEHVLFPKPGTLRVEIVDINRDGHDDLAVLVAQETEAMMFFLGDGKGGFTERRVFQMHPAFGSSCFELKDFNGDGRLDILVVNGDVDYPSPPRPYHGVRIFLSEGDLRFRESYFFRLPGAYSATAEDFDGDGDLDIAVTVFNVDYVRTPMTGFVYLENKGEMSFEPSTFAGNAVGRWLTMGAVDIDADGDPDLVLGSTVMGPGIDGLVPPGLRNMWRERPVSTLVLENVFKKAPAKGDGK